MQLRSSCLWLLATALTVQAQTPNVMINGNGGRGGRGGAVGQLQQGPAQPPPPPPATDCVISGTVVNAVTGAPIPRAQVVVGSNGSATNASGQWSISNATCGMTIPNATKAGFLNGMIDPATTKRIQLVSGTPVTGVKISLRPEATVTGKVQDETGDPIPNAQVTVLRAVVQNGKRTMQQFQGAGTDSLGTFHVGNLQAGRIIVCAMSRERVFPVGGGDPLLYQDECYPGPVSAGAAAAMPIEGGRDTRVVITLKTQRGAHVRGTVSGLAVSGGPGNPQPRVQLMSRNQSQMGVFGANVIVNRDGTFDITPVPPGSYMARLIVPTAGPQQGRQQFAGEAAVEVGASDVNNVTLTPTTPGSINGTVRFELVNPNSSTDASNSPVNIIIRPAEPAMGGLSGQPQWDESHQNFVLQDVTPGAYLINANVGGSGFYVKAALFHGQNVLGRNVTVEGVTGPIDFVVSDDSGAVTVAVTDADGQPATGLVILIRGSDPPVFLPVADPGSGTRKGLPGGDYKIWAFDAITQGDIPWAEDDWMRQHAGQPEKVTIATGATANVTLKRIAIPRE